jgi:hypothetical protein
MPSKIHGGPAFPAPAEQLMRDPNGEMISASAFGYHQQEGMTLRDYFAAKAIQSIYARLGGSSSAGNNHDGLLTHMAEDAYAMADAMLTARGES